MPSTISALIGTSGRCSRTTAAAAASARSACRISGSPPEVGNFAIPYAQWSTTETRRSGQPRRAASSAPHRTAAVAAGEPSVPTTIWPGMGAPSSAASSTVGPPPGEALQGRVVPTTGWVPGPYGHRGMLDSWEVVRMESKRWTVEIFVNEDDEDDVTTATAVLYTPSGRRHESVGRARRNPADRPVPEIGDELAAGRALADLGSKLIGDGAEDVAQLAGPAYESY